MKYKDVWNNLDSTSGWEIFTACQVFGIWDECKIMKFKYIFSILRDILINCVSPFYVHAEGRDIKSERKTVKILICDAPFLTL